MVRDAPYLKGNTNRKNTIQVSEYLIRVPRECIKIHKDVFLTMDIFFVDKITFFLTLIRNIDFTDTSHLSFYKARDIFKDFWRIYVFYLKRGLRKNPVQRMLEIFYS